jgi:homoserine dehydrogenase
LRQLQTRQPETLRLVAVSDRSGTVFQREGLVVDEIVTHKHRGGSLSECGGAETIPTELAIRLVSADIVVDATPSKSEDVEAAVLRGRTALQCGASLALCSKNGLAEAAAEWLAPATRKRVLVNAVLGGTGAQLLAELDELQRECQGLALVGNVTTTAIITAIEGGASIEEGIGEARRLGFLEPDATLDLDGSDAATKLLCVWSALFGSTFTKSPGLASVKREDVRDLDPAALRERTSRGATTRLIARGGRSGTELRVAFDEVALGSPLAVPADRVAYGYELPSGLRVHTGLGVGYERTAQALWADVNAKLQETQQ